MKATRAQIERGLDSAASDIRFFLLYGPDESQSRDLAARLAKRLGPDAERIDLSGPALKADPARLADEAASMSLFGGARHIRVEPAGDEIMEAIEALLEAPSTGNPVAIVAGALRKDSKLLKLALADPAAMAFASYLPEGVDADRLAATIAREHGLRIEPEIVQMLAASTGGDRALMTREIEKLALFADATPGSPAALDMEMFEQISADSGEGSLARLVEIVMSGRSEAVSAEVARLAVDGVEGIAILRPLLRRLLLLAQLRSQIDTGDSIESVMGTAGRAIFWKEKAVVSSQLTRWDGEKLATAIARVLAAERQVKASGSAGPILVDVELIAIARAAARLR